MASEVVIESQSLVQLNDVAEQIVSYAEEDKIWLFLGDMGAGKTTSIKEICKVLGVVDEVTSPTFSIVNEYQTKENKSVYHFDFYRIDDVEEALNIGIEEYFDSGNICLIEWPQNVEAILPEQFLRIDISQHSDSTRSFKLSRHE